MLLTSLNSSPVLPSIASRRDGSSPDETTQADGSSSVYSLSSVPLYDAASCISTGLSSGTLPPYGSAVVPVTFRPRNTGRIDCRCKVSLYKDADDLSSEKDIDFSGVGVRPDDSAVRASNAGGIPGLAVAPLCVEFVGGAGDTRLKRGLVLKNGSHHVKKIFLSQPDKPFEIHAASLTLEKGASQIHVYCRSKARGVFEDVLVLCDDEGNSTSVMLRAEVQ